MKKLAIVLSGILMLESAIPALTTYAAPIQSYETVIEDTEAVEGIKISENANEIITEEIIYDVEKEEVVLEIFPQESVSQNAIESETLTTVDVAPFEETDVESKNSDITETSTEFFEWDSTHKKITKYIGEDANVVIPKEAASIEANAFQNNKTIESVTITENITSIGNNAFKSASNLTEVIFLGDKIKSIGDYAFSYTSISQIDLPESLEYISAYLFYGNKKLSEITIPKNVTGIGFWAFMDCNNLSSVNFETTKLTRDGCGDAVFGNCSVNIFK